MGLNGNDFSNFHACQVELRSATIDVQQYQLNIQDQNICSRHSTAASKVRSLLVPHKVKQQKKLRHSEHALYNVPINTCKHNLFHPFGAWGAIDRAVLGDLNTCMVIVTQYFIYINLTSATF